jgi:hypothetical protein
MSAAAKTLDPLPAAGSPTDGRLPVLLWLAWRFLPPLDRADLRTLVRVGAACAYLAMPLTVALAAEGLPGTTAVSLLCLSVPGLPPLWRNAIRLGDRRRGTALALRQVRLSRRAATLTSLSRQLAYPLGGALLGVLLILLLHGPLGSILPDAAPLTVAIENSSAGWAYAAPLAALSLVWLTLLLGSEPAKAVGRWIGRTLSRGERSEAEPQPQ